MCAFEFLYTGMSFDMFLEIAHLAESWTAVGVCTFVWFFTCVDPKMSKELAHSLNDFVALNSTLFVVAFEKSILFFKIILFFYKIEHVVRRVWYVIWVAKHSWVEFVALNNSNLIIWKNLVLLHESLCQYFLSWEKGQIIETIKIDVLGYFIFDVLLWWNNIYKVRSVLGISNNLKWTFDFMLSEPIRVLVAAGAAGLLLGDIFGSSVDF